MLYLCPDTFSDGNYLQRRTCSVIPVFGKPSALCPRTHKPQKRRNLNTIQFLFAHGASVNVPYDGDTPLYMGLRFPVFDVVELLVKCRWMWRHRTGRIRYHFIKLQRWKS